MTSERSTRQIRPHFSITVVEIGHMDLELELYFFMVDKILSVCVD